MGFQYVDIKATTNYVEAEIEQIIARKLTLKNFSWQIENKSLDARNKSNIHWALRIGVSSAELTKNEKVYTEEIKFSNVGQGKKVIIVGSGPAGYFAALALQKSGFSTTILERGAEVDKRTQCIENFEATGKFSSIGNYAFGEGGAGTFSDGKLTSRSKHISKEKNFILGSYVEAGAPNEILYMKHPHLGSDNLKIIVKILRHNYEQLGGGFLFEEQFSALKINKDKVIEVSSLNKTWQADYLLLATGHSSYETYSLLIENNIPFRPKNFALGFRAEHPQHIINQAQWGRPTLEGVKAAEYRLSSKADKKHAVFSFCMCPGGVVVPATAYEKLNIVNGMSLYRRDGEFANAACVASVNPLEFVGEDASPQDVLHWLNDLEKQFYDFDNSYKAPACTIESFLKEKEGKGLKTSSYPLGLQSAPLWNMLPSSIISALQLGLHDFSRKLKGFEKGQLLGLESKTSSPIQVCRNREGLIDGFSNMYMVGEGSGYAGGIISSAADGLKAALHIIMKQ
jgi:uncharacterized FAD-dependent dehydrogenase